MHNSGQTQKFHEEPRDISVTRGEDVVLRCSVVNLEGTLQWLKNGFGLGPGPLFDGYPRYRILQQPPDNGITVTSQTPSFLNATVSCVVLQRRGTKKISWMCPFLERVAVSPSNTMSPGLRPTSVLSAILIHPAVWPQQTWAEKWAGAVKRYAQCYQTVVCV